MNRHIAIDGPAGSGKSTIAKIVAARRGLIYVDTGAMYRAMAIHFLRLGLSADDEEGITKACESADVTIDYVDGQQQVILCGENVTPYLRQEETGKMASASSVYAAVRNKMTVLQQKLAAEKTVVMDGRDIGTVVLPDAFLKVYMTASADVRAKRRFDRELQVGGVEFQEQAVVQPRHGGICPHRVYRVREVCVPEGVERRSLRHGDVLHQYRAKRRRKRRGTRRAVDRLLHAIRVRERAERRAKPRRELHEIGILQFYILFIVLTH